MTVSSQLISVGGGGSTRRRVVCCDTVSVSVVSRWRASLSVRQQCDTLLSMPADSELSTLLSRRQAINEALGEGKEVKPTFKQIPRSVYAEFHEFSRRQIKEYENTFNKYDEGRDGFLDLQELKWMMEKLGAPQTHLGLKAMIKEVDEDDDNRISFREFLLIFRKAKAGELVEESGLSKLAQLTEISVEEVGVGGAKHFFEAKIEELRRGSKFEDEIRQEQEERRREEEEKAQRRIAFKEKAALFQNGH